jgi:dTDP-4-dehydrorhamnose 3,5-epimerase
VIFHETALHGSYILEPEPVEDERGFFARTFCRNEFEKHGLNPTVAQCNISFNKKKGTLRGMHFQRPPHEEAKLVRCTKGLIFDVIIDLRPQSDTYKRWTAVELSAANHKMLYIPPGVAHGFLTLTDCTEVLYQMSEFYYPGSAAGVRWDDPAFNIRWPETPLVISERDNTYKDFQP